MKFDQILRKVEEALSKYGQGRYSLEYGGRISDGIMEVEEYCIRASFDSFAVSYPVLRLRYRKEGFLGNRRLVDFEVYSAKEVIKGLEILIHLDMLHSKIKGSEQKPRKYECVFSEGGECGVLKSLSDFLEKTKEVKG
jgi:hypothetical protein